MVADGCRDAGYIAINQDSGWWDGANPWDAAGYLQADPKHFPSGMAGLASYMAERGLQLGTYALMDGGCPPGKCDRPVFVHGRWQ